MSRFACFLAAVTTFGICCVGPVLGQTDYDQPDETLPGFKSTNVYHDLGSVDHVSVYSGDTGIVIPLGPEYPLGQGLSWQLKAFHSAKMWTYDAHCTTGGAPLGHGVITGYPTLGAGWTLDGGHIGQTKNGTWFFQSPDGGRHDFAIAPLAATTTQYFTWDSTHERVTWYPALSYFTVEFPGGGTQYFEHPYTRPVPLNGDPAPDFNDQRYGAIPDTRWGLTRYVDRFNSLVLKVNYTGTEPWMVSSIVLTPNGTARTINFNWKTYQVTNSGPPIYGPGTLTLSPNWRVLGSIDFPTVAGRTLTTTFNFIPGTFHRSGFYDGVSYSTCAADTTTPSFVAVPLLSSIAVSGYLVNQTWSFTYNGQNSTPWPFGGLLTLQLPTNGKIQYVYGATTYDCPLPSCGGPSSASMTSPNIPSGGRPDFFNFSDASPAVVSRSEKDANDVVLSTINYDRFDYWVSLSPTNYSTTQTVRQVRIHRPDGNGNVIADRYLFHVSLSKSLVSTDTTSGLELVHYFYNSDDPSTPTPIPIRAVVSCYDTDSVTGACGYATGSTYDSSTITAYSGLNARAQKHVTWYGDNPASTLTVNGGDCTQTATIPCWQSAFSGYDGYGEYGTETKIANNGGLEPTGGATWQNRTATTHWTPQTGAAWLLELFDWRQVADQYSTGCPVSAAPCSVKSNYGFNLTNGFLQSIQRVDAASGNNITRAFTPDSVWNPITEVVSGGGSEFSPTQFTTSRTFDQHGLLLTRQQSGLAPSWKAVDVTRDASTGVITAARDPNGLTTTYAYDALNRLIAINPPPGEVATSYCYKLMSGGTAYNYVLAKKGAPSACSTDDGAPGLGSGAFEAYLYDALGRLSRGMRRQPNPLSLGSFFAFRQTSLNAAGLPSSVSEWNPCSGGSDVTACFGTPALSGTSASFQNYDFLGRARLITAADGTYTTRSFDDILAIPQILNSDFTEFTALSNVGGQSVAWGSRKDLLDHVLAVADPTNGTIPAIGPITYYDYNTLGKLTDAKVSGTQTRTFAYDALGLLQSENHPETGTTTFGGPAGYDALGNVLKKTQGGHTYSYTYDAASRLNTVVADGSTYISNFYDGQGYAGGTYPLGRPTQQNGYHPLSPVNVRVVRNYAYSDPTGRLSWKGVTAYNPAAIFTATESFTYNALGLPDTHNHSRVSGSWPVTTGYKSGLPTQITSGSLTLISSATYNPAGGLQSYVTGNGVTTTINQDSHLLPRPLSIVTSGADQNFSSGNYSYDGAGNILSIGSDTFRYDASSRLTEARYWSSGSQYDTLGYDVFGNLKSRQTEQGSQTLTTDTTTNRLSAAYYDLLGNLTGNGTDQHSYDALSRQTLYTGINANERYFYDAAGERIARVVYASSLPQQSTQGRFYTLTPCRILDTRKPAGTYGAPAIAGQGSRSFPAAGVCGIPSGAKSLALNVTTANATAPTGNVRLYPTGLSYRPVGTANVYMAGYTRANQTFGSIDGPTAGSFTLFNDAPAGYPVDVIVDVSGYFAPGPNTPPQTGDSWFFTLREPQNRPSTEYRWDSATSTTTLLKDHVYLGNLLVADYTWSGQPNGLVFYTNDHLGSPRFMTEGSVPMWMATFKYRAFGLALTSQIPGQGPEFAGMERDLASSDLYDHARYMGGKLPRFNSPDQLGGHIEDPQSWNRYAYARNNPLKYVDPNGKSAIAAALPLLGSLPLTPPQLLVLNAAGGYAAGRAIGQMSIGGMTIDERVTRLFTGLIAGPDKVEIGPITLTRGGESPEARYGREQHKQWDAGPGFGKEVTLPSGRRADAVNPETREVKELKPDNPDAIRRGEKQVERYRQELEKETGQEWTGKVETYRRPPD